jgi:hypothetical protein
MSRYSMFVACGAMCLASGVAHAQTASQTVGFEVQSINVLSATGSPSLVINTAVPGSQPTQATASGSYAITTNEASRKITIEIDTLMPANVTLKATLAAPTGASSAGPITLTTTPTDAVTAVATVAQSGLSISYTLDATVAAGVVPAGTRHVTLTIVAGP